MAEERYDHEDECFNLIKQKLHDDDIMVYTSKGRAVSLAAGTTVQDFAKAVDEELAKEIKGIKINGKPASLFQELRQNDIVTFIM